MNKLEKEALIKEYNEIFSSAVSGVLVDYRGSSVEELTNLRKTLHNKDSKFRVVKNTLAKRAVTGTPYEGLSEYFVNTRAFVYSDSDAVAAAKILSKAADDNDNLNLIAGSLVTGDVGEVLDVEGIKALSNLPSKEELIAKLLFVLNAPITNFVKVLNEVPASFVRTLQAIADSKK